ncbi:hypothetical protein JCM3766R1_003142 [Sporobolomyces carnicolor]
MAEQTATPPPAYLKHALEAGRVTVICWLVLYLFDFFLTFAAERRHVWRTRWTPLKTFYFCNRYVTLAAIVGNAVLVLAQWTPAACSKICWIQPVLCTVAVTLALPLLIMSGLTIGLSTQVKPFVVPAALSDQLKYAGCIAVQSRKRTFLVIWILPLCFDCLVLLLALGRSISLRRKASAGSAVHTLVRIVNKHVLYFSIIAACNALNVAFFIFADPSLKSINVPATVALTSILTDRLVLSLFSTSSTSPVPCPPTRRPSASSNSSDSRRGGTWSESHSKLPSRSATSASGGIPSLGSAFSEKDGSHEGGDEKDGTVDRGLNTNSSRAPSSEKQPSISSRASTKTSGSSDPTTNTASTSGSSSRRRRSRDLRYGGGGGGGASGPPGHVIVPVVPDPSRYNYYSHRHSHSTSSSSGGVLRPLLLANSLVPAAAASSSPAVLDPNLISGVVTQPLQPHPNPSMVIPSPPPPSSSVSGSSRAPVPPQTTLDSTILSVAGGRAALELPGIEPSTPLTFSAVFFDPPPPRDPPRQGPLSSPNLGNTEDDDERKSFQSPLNVARRRQPRPCRRRSDEGSLDNDSEGNRFFDDDDAGGEEDEDEDEDEDEEEFGMTGDLGEMTRENRDKYRREQAAAAAAATLAAQDDRWDAQRHRRRLARSVPIASVFSSSDDGAPNDDEDVRSRRRETTTTFATAPASDEHDGSSSGGSGSGAPSSIRSKRSSAHSLASTSSAPLSQRGTGTGREGGGGGDRRSISRTSLKYFTDQFPNPHDMVKTSLSSSSSFVSGPRPSAVEKGKQVDRAQS